MEKYEELTNVQTLSGEQDFNMWKFQVGIIFKSYGLYEIVQGSDQSIRLSSDGSNLAELERKDARAQKVIMNTINRKHLPLLMTCENARQMYEKLCFMFEKSTDDQKCTLWEKFFEYKFDTANDITYHVSSVENIAFKLKTLCEKVSDNMIISKILSTLPECYNPFKTAWDSSPISEKTHINLTARLLTEEKRLNSDKQTGTPVAFKATHKNYNQKQHNKKCSICKKNNHIEKECFFKNKICSFCKKSNHKEENCFFRNKTLKPYKQNKNSYIAFMSERKRNENKNFIVDSGSTCHMTNNRKILSKIVKQDSNISVAKKNEQLISHEKGNIETEKCLIKNVLYVPDLEKNLLSVNAITDNDGTVTFTDKNVYIKKNDLTLIGNKTNTGLYTIDFNTIEYANSAILKDSVLDWHIKLGHPSSEIMKNMLKNNLVIGMDIKIQDIKDFSDCETCHKAKQTRKPHKSIRHRAQRPLEIIHSDLCGPINPSTYNDEKYILTFLDDYTHHLKIQLLKRKDETTEYIKNYIEESERKYGKNISTIRCDNGGEYSSTDLKQYAFKKGIIIDYTIPYTPQLNGKAERVNRTLLEKTRALLCDSNLSKKMWGEAARTAAFLMNRTATETTEKVPVEMLTGEKPNIKSLIKFGSTVYSKRLGNIQKLDDRSEKMIFIGYATNGYRLWDENRRKVLIRRDIKSASVTDKNKDEIEVIKQNDLLSDDGDNSNTNNYDEIIVGDLKNETDKEINITNSTTGDKQENKMLSNTSVDCKNEFILHDTNSIDKLEENEKEKQDENTEYDNKINKRCKRLVKKPVKLKDYVLLTYEEALKGNNKEKWQKAIEEEKNSILENKTWTVVKTVPEDLKIFTSKWVLKIKEDGRYKARLVIRGFEQEEGIDYHETFSPVINSSPLRLLFVICKQNNFNIKTFDIKTAFLYGAIEEDIYMYPPEGMEEIKGICKLNKALYGMKQAPLKWNNTLTNFLKSEGLNQLKTEPCIFKNKDQTMFLGIHVDDGILIGRDNKEIDQLLEKIRKTFKTTVDNNPKKYLGMEISQTEYYIKLTQKKYINKLLEDYNMREAKTAITPIESTKQENMTKITSFPYRQLLGSLTYLSNKTRPDISFAVNHSSRNAENPSESDVTTLKRILRYLKETKEKGLKYEKQFEDDNLKLTAYCDADFAGDTKTRRSTTGYIIYFAKCPISWCTRQQPIVALSTAEAEYIAAAECVKELLYLKSVCEELLFKSISVKLYVDNQSAINLINNGVLNRRSKHIDVRYKFICEKVLNKELSIEYCPTDSQIADIFTKALKSVKFNFFKDFIIS